MKTLTREGNSATKRKRSSSQSRSRSSSSKRKIGRTRKTTSDGKYDCPICMMEITEQDTVAKLKCGHKFHKDCMASVCKHGNQEQCLCPMCRRKLEQEELTELGVVLEPRPKPPQIVLPPSLHTEAQFKEFINTKLRAPTRRPAHILLEILDAFLGTDRLPVDVFDKILVFDLQQMASLSRYRFTGLVDEIPRQRGNALYFKYDIDDDGIAEDVNIV